VELVRAHRERGRRVLVFKAGRTEHGAQAAASHTASLAGDYPVARDLLLDAGAVVCETLDELEDLTKTFAMLYDRAPVGRRVGVVSNAGFECSAAMDALFALEPARFSDDTRSALAAALPSMAHGDNPVDATPMATTEQYVRAVEAVLSDPDVDVVVVAGVPVTPALNDLPPDPGFVHAENIHAAGSLPQELIRVIGASSKPVVASVDSGALYDPFVALLQRAGIPTFRRIDRATRALSRYCASRLG
jgi:acyl-CoA synthetase (NDP forming)